MARGMAFGPFPDALNRRLDRMSEPGLEEAIRALACPGIREPTGPVSDPSFASVAQPRPWA